MLAIIKLGFRRQGAAAGRRSGPEESLALNVTAWDPNMDSCLGSAESESTYKYYFYSPTFKHL